MATIQIPVRLSGEIVVTEDAVARELEELTISIEPVQDLHGYDHPWANAGNANILPPITKGTYTGGGITVTVGDNNFITVSGTKNTNSAVTIEMGYDVSGYSNIVGYYIHQRNSQQVNNTRLYLGTASTVYSALSSANRIQQANSVFQFESCAMNFSSNVASGTELNFTLQPSIEPTSDTTDWTPFANICPISGHTTCNIYRETEYDADADPTVTIDLDGTRYGGNINVLTGEMTVTDANIASYNGETLPSTWISDRDVYTEGGTPTTGAQVVYKLASSYTVQLSPNTLSMLEGTNYVWNNTGDTTLIYYRSIDMSLTKMYPAMPGSPKTSLAEGISAVATSMTLDDASVLPSAPNICVIGADSNAEVVSYSSIVGNVVSGLVRGLGGTTASAWTFNTMVARNFTSLDHNTFILNITDLDTRKADLASPALTGTPTAPTPALNTDSTQIATTAFVQDHAPIHLSVTASAGSAITKSDTRITSTMRVINVVFGTPGNVTSNITWTTSAGSVTFNATFTGSTTIDFDLVETN